MRKAGGERWWVGPVSQQERGNVFLASQAGCLNVAPPHTHTHKPCLNTVISTSNYQLILRGCDCKCPGNWKQRRAQPTVQHRRPACGPTHRLEHRMRTSFPRPKSAENKAENHKSEVPCTFALTLTQESIVCLLRLVC